MKDYRFLQQKYIVNTYTNRDLTLVRGDGIYLYDTDETEYLDLMSNYGASIFGYNHPILIKALTEQLNTLISLHGSFTNDIRSETAELLVKRCGVPYAQVYWSNSGTEAIEAGMKFAMLASQKRHFVACEKSYHGKTLGALSLTYSEKYKKAFEPLTPNVTHIPFNDPDALLSAITTDTAAFIVEPIQGESGIIRRDEGYLQKVKEICKEKGILLILDEIQTGIGRTGTFLASEKDGVAADILCLSKGIAAGLAVGATVITQEVATHIPKHVQSSTIAGNPLSMAAVKTVLELLDEKRLEYIRQVGEYFVSQLKDIQSDKIKEIRGEGLMLGVCVTEGRDKILKALQDNKILSIPAGDDVVRFLPPYIIQKEHVDKAIQTLQKIFNT